MTRPNIIYLHSHDTGRYVQPYGYAVRTPRLQRFAREGVLFRQAFCANPTCSPSRASLLTGQWAHSAGMFGLAHRGFPIGDMRRHLVHTLGPAGYQTLLAGVQHVAKKPEQVGYDRLLKTPGLHAAQVAPAAAEFLRSDDAKQPFFLDVGFFETHRPFPEADPLDDARYTRPPAPLPDHPSTRRDMARYNTMANDLDRGVGQVLDALDEAGLADNTLVIITTDHGLAFPGMKCNLTDHGIGVMLMMRGPTGDGKRIEAGKVIDALVSHVDLFPTLCDITGIEPPAWLQGVSLLPLLQGRVSQVREEIFAEVNFHAVYEPMRAIRTSRYKYIRRLGKRDAPAMANCDDSDSKTLLVEHQWNERPHRREQLYDLVFDPHEANNLADDPELAQVKAELAGRLDQWMRRTDDPILRGPLTVPAGSQINATDSPSPSEPTETVAADRLAE